MLALSLDECEMIRSFVQPYCSQCVIKRARTLGKNNIFTYASLGKMNISYYYFGANAKNVFEWSSK